MKIKVNEITQIYDNQYQLILDFPSIDILYKIVNPNYKYVWIYNHTEIGPSWNKYNNVKIFDYIVPNVMLRNQTFDILLETTDFIKLIPQIKEHVNLNIIQTNKKPPYYINANKFMKRDKTWYRLLNSDLEYLFEFEYQNDFCPLVSPNRLFLESVLDYIKRSES